MPRSIAKPASFACFAAARKSAKDGFRYQATCANRAPSTASLQFPNAAMITPEAPAGTGAKWLLSKGGGFRLLWGTDGTQLYYLTPTVQVMAVDIDASKGFQAGTPRRMFTGPIQALGTNWDLSPDGKRFLFVAPPGSGRIIPFTVVLNWAAGLKK